MLSLLLNLSGCALLGKRESTSPLKIKAAGFMGGSIAWLITSKGEFLKTEDAGNNWNTVSANQIGGFEQVDFINEQQGWAVNSKAQVWHTLNGGLDWARLATLDYTSEPFVGPIHKIKFVDAAHGWIVDPFSVWRTDDGGKHWEKIVPWATSDDIKEVVYSCYFINSDIGWLGGDHGAVYSTNDGGRSWQAKRIAPKDMLFDTIEFIDDKAGLVSTKPINIIYLTDDGGETWRGTPLSDINDSWRLLSINFINNNEGWAAGLDNSAVGGNSRGLLLHSLDGGHTWQSIQTGIDELFFLIVGFTSVNEGWLIGYNNVYRTADGGKSWLTVLKLK
jgi:photosystem II stability/assembly factor-like uncharacterized protein